MATYKRLDVAFARGEGAYLWDEAGRRYLDALAGIAVCGLGHAHPKVAQAVCEQARTLVHTSNLYRIPAQERLAERLAALSGLERAFLCNSGAEANEAAFKIARKYAHQRGIAAPHIIVAEGSFHGRTLATLSATGNAKIREGYEPLPPGFIRVPYDDVESVARARAAEPGAVAVMVEPVQGEGGIRVPAPDYLARLRRLCDEHGMLLMLDEIQTGLCRSGRWFAHQHAGIVPDVMSLAKSLGNGVPIGVCLARQRYADVFTPGSHGSTFGGNPLACRAALAVLEVLSESNIAERARTLGARMLRAFEPLRGLPGVRDVRGLGLLLGIELEQPCGALVERALQRGLLINVTVDRVIRLLPPLIITDEQAREITGTVSALVREFVAQEQPA
jgi:acetylornithine aminotransferase